MFIYDHIAKSSTCKPKYFILGLIHVSSLIRHTGEAKGLYGKWVEGWTISR